MIIMVHLPSSCTAQRHANILSRRGSLTFAFISCLENKIMRQAMNHKAQLIVRAGYVSS